jgi:hypothetical protein
MYLALRYHGAISIQSDRGKKGLVNAVGDIMNTLFGICEDNCTTRADEQIKQIEESEINTLHLMKSQTTVIKMAVQLIGTTINQTYNLYEKLRIKEN